MTDSTDIVIAGGGIAGMVATATMARAGFHVTCVDLAPADTAPDMRSTAFMQPSKQVLIDCGLWDRISDQAMPLERMRIVDAGGPDGEPRVIREFVADDISDQPFAWNLPNQLLRDQFSAALRDMENANLIQGDAVKSLFIRTTSAKVTLHSGGRITAKLIIGADGRNSTVRQAAGIRTQTLRYGQKALAFAVTHPIPHGNVSTEVHKSGGPFTLVPLPDRYGKPCSAVVWMEEGPEVQRLAALDDAAFNAEMSDRSCHLFGPLELASPRAVWPIITQWANHLSAERIALIAESAHVLPPIGAQGLNMSLADIAALRDLAAKYELGSAAMLDAYHKQRHPVICARASGINLLNRASISDQKIIKDMRASGLKALHDIKPIRTNLMRIGMGGNG